MCALGLPGLDSCKPVHNLKDSANCILMSKLVSTQKQPDTKHTQAVPVRVTFRVYPGRNFALDSN